jgi:hypothetical protein
MGELAEARKHMSEARNHTDMSHLEANTSDRLAIQDLAYRYAAGVDRRDEDLLLSAFLPDATLTVGRSGPDGKEHLRVLTGHDELRAITRLIARYAKTFHFVGNHRCDIDGDVANGEVYCTAHHFDAGPEGETDYVMLIRYQDVYRRDSAGQWLIASRRLVVDRTETHTVR